MARPPKINSSSKFEDGDSDPVSSRLSHNRPAEELERITNNLTRASASTLSDYMSKLAHDRSLPLDQRIEALRDIQFAAGDLIEEIAPKVPEKAPLLWRNRADRDIDPYVFARQVYADCADIITKTDLERLDRTLVTMMHRRDSKLGKADPSLYIPTARERNDALVTSVAWADILEAAPENIRRMLRAYHARATRKRNALNP